MKQKLLIANWKLNPQKLAEAQKLVQAFNKTKTKHKIAICPPFPYLGLLKTRHALGSQDLFWQEQGPFTGQVSGSMLRQFKVKYAIIGHSESRALGETDPEVNAKITAALANKITPVLCVGYGLQPNEPEGDVLVHLQHQLQEDLINIDPAKITVAYEPVWAIGSGHPATADHAERVSMFIKIKFGIKKVLYGGSTNASNTEQFLSKDIDGLLVGGSSLKPEEFTKMMQVQ